MIEADLSLVKSHLSDRDFEDALPKALEVLSSLLRREGPGSEFLGWLDLPKMPEREVRRIVDWGKKIQDENDCLVVIGIGGSYMGAKAAIEALPKEAAFPVMFAGTNCSPEMQVGLLRQLEGKKFAVCVVSKSGTTLEPAIALRIFRNALMERFGEEGAKRRITAVTDPERGVLRAEAERNGWETFEIPRNVGGRFSVLSAVGLLPCAAANIPVREIVSGAASTMEKATAMDSSNDCLRYATTRWLLHEKGIKIEVLSTFHPELESFGEWWKQLAAESEGKSNRGLFPASAIMTTDLHSLGQYLQEGPRNILETFLIASTHRVECRIPGTRKEQDGLDFLEGIDLGEVNRRAFEGTREAHSAGGIPIATIMVPSITPESVGSLFAFFEVSIAISARLLGVNPFDQPGVEEYKKRMYRLLGKPGSS